MVRNNFQQASKRQARARIGMSGPSGSGKTMWSLQWATVLAGDGKIAMIDTERGSASLYADRFKFDVLQMTPPFHPDRLVDALNEARDAGYKVVIIDSLTHFWSGQGGVLELVDEASARFKGNTHAAWQVGTPIQQRMVDAILGFEGHVIATMRAKTEWVMEQNAGGKTAPRKIGLAPQQRADIEFEFTLFFDLDHLHRASVSKTRYDSFADKVFNPEESEKSAVLFADWLTQGESVSSATAMDTLSSRIAGLNESTREVLKSRWREQNWPKINRLTATQTEEAHALIDALEAPEVPFPTPTEDRTETPTTVRQALKLVPSKPTETQVLVESMLEPEEAF